MNLLAQLAPNQPCKNQVASKPNKIVPISLPGMPRKMVHELDH